jgi:hypothetical protein
MAGMSEKNPLSVEDKTPKFIPAPETWAFCEKIAKDRNLTPKEIFNRFVALGEMVTKLNERGVVVAANTPSGSIEMCIEMFDKKEVPVSPPHNLAP